MKFLIKYKNKDEQVNLTQWKKDWDLVNKLPIDMAASFWLARQGLYGEVYKEENINGSVVRTLKKHKEAVVFPYDNLLKAEQERNEV